MNQRRNFYSYLIDAAVFIFLEVAALIILAHNGEIQKLWLNRASHGFINYVWGKTEGVKYYFSLNKYNKELEIKNFHLEQEIRRYEQFMLSPSENKSDTIGRFSYTPARITKLSSNKQHNFIIINKGSNDGVKPQSGLITNKGIIGVIESVSKNYSYALSFMNEQLSVSARIKRDGPVGILKWTGKNYSSALLEGIPCHIPISVGDSLYTSGYSDLFPEDIPLGVCRSMDILNGATYSINVELFENFKALRSVTIVNNIDKEELQKLENTNITDYERN